MKIKHFKTAFGFLFATVVVAFFAPMAIEMKFVPIPLGIFVWTILIVGILVPFSALPIYLIFTSWLGFNYKSVVLAAVVAVVLVSSFFVFPHMHERSVVNGIVLAENGSVTLSGYLHGFERLIAFALVGFVAGNTFYFSASVGNES